jgi:hypothetical protein
MTTYYQAWLELIQQRDELYLLIFVAAALGYAWYRFLFRRFFKLILTIICILVALGLLWGLMILLRG